MKFKLIIGLIECCPFSLTFPNCRFLESLLNYYVDQCSLSLPELHLCMDHCGSVMLNQPSHLSHVNKKNGHKRSQDTTLSDSKKTRKKISKSMTSSDTNEKCRQPTILEVLKKVGAATSQEVPNDNASSLSSNAKSAELSKQHSCDSHAPVEVEISAVTKALETQSFKFRRLLVQCLFILTLSKVHFLIQQKSIIS